MSKYSHRSVKELKTFIKKYNEHFRIMLTGKKKTDLIREIENGMKKTVSDELKKAHDELLIKTPKEKKSKVDKPKVETPKVEPKKTMKKEDEVRPAKKAFPPIPKNIRGKRVNVKFEKPATKERIETGDINLGKLEEPKPKLEALKVVKGKKKSIELEPTKKLKTIKVKKEEPKKKAEPKKAPFLEELKETDISILEDAGIYDLQRGGRCSDLITVSKYIIKAEKDKFKKVRIFKLSDIKTDIYNVGSWELNNPTPLAIIYNYFFQLIEDEKYFIRVKNECGVRNLLFVEKAYQILLDNFDLIKNKIIEQNKRYNPKIDSIMKERKLKDIEFNLTEKKEEQKKPEPKKKAEPKKEEPDAKNQKKIMSALNSINNDINEISQLIRSNPKFNIDKPTLTEKQVFKNSMFDNLNDLESAIKDFDNQTFFLQNKEIKNKMDDIKDKMPFIKDQIKKPKK